MDNNELTDYEISQVRAMCMTRSGGVAPEEEMIVVARWASKTRVTADCLDQVLDGKVRLSFHDREMVFSAPEVMIGDKQDSQHYCMLCVPDIDMTDEDDHGARQLFQQAAQNTEFKEWFYSAMEQSDPAEFGDH